MANGLSPDSHPFTPDIDIAGFDQLSESKQNQLNLLSNTYYFLGLAREKDFFESIIKPATKDLNPITHPDVITGGLVNKGYPKGLICALNERINGNEQFYDPADDINYQERLDLLYSRIDPYNPSPSDIEQIVLLQEKIQLNSIPKPITGVLQPPKIRRLTTHQAVSHILQHTASFPMVMKSIESGSPSTEQSYGLRLIWLALGDYNLQSTSNPYGLTYTNPLASQHIFKDEGLNPETERQRHIDTVILSRLDDSNRIEDLWYWIHEQRVNNP